MRPRSRMPGFATGNFATLEQLFLIRSAFKRPYDGCGSIAVFPERLLSASSGKLGRKSRPSKSVMPNAGQKVSVQTGRIGNYNGCIQGHCG